MKKERTLPLWTKLVLAAMLLITLVCAAALLFCDLQFRRASAHGELPSLNGSYYFAVPDARFGQDYPKGALLTARPETEYPVGSTLLVRCQGTDTPHRIAGSYCLIRLSELSAQEYRGVYADGGSVETLGLPGDILGKVTAVVPVLGGFYELMVGGPGYLLFLLLPVAASAIWALVLVNLWSKRRKRPIPAVQAELPVAPAAPPPTIPPPEVITTAAQLPRREKPGVSTKSSVHNAAEVFDVFEEPAELGYLRQSLGMPGPVSAPPAEAKPAPLSGEAPLITAPPPTQEAVNLPVSVEADTPPAADAPCVTPPPSPPVPDVEEAVAIYTRQGQGSEKFAPPYLHRNFSDSLEQLRTSLRHSATHSPRVEIIVGEQAAGLDEEYRRRLHEINSFDPDKIIAEIKQKNALYQQTLLGDMPPAKPDKLAIPPVPASQPRKVFHAYPLHTASETRHVTAEEVARIHRQDFDEQRFRPSYITVVEADREKSK